MGFFISEEEYERILGILRQARSVAADNDVFWDLEGHEDVNQVVKGFRYVAAREGIDVDIAPVEGKQSLTLFFRKPYVRKPRIDGEQYKAAILEVLSESGEKLTKSDILQRGELSPSAWYLRIRELVEEGKVVREGDRGQAVYYLT